MRISKEDIVKREVKAVEVIVTAVNAGEVPTVKLVQDALVALDGRKMRPTRVIELIRENAPDVVAVV